jgi:hypothetical protein
VISIVILVLSFRHKLFQEKGFSSIEFHQLKFKDSSFWVIDPAAAAFSLEVIQSFKRLLEKLQIGLLSPSPP